MAYHQFTDPRGEDLPPDVKRTGYGSFEVFWRHEGWYWWTCSPGCLPDSEPTGPFESEQAAIDDANDF